MNVQPRPIIQLLEIPDAGGGRTFVVTQSVMLVEDDVRGVAVDVALALAMLPWNRGGLGYTVAVADAYDAAHPHQTFTEVTGAALTWLDYPAGPVDALTAKVQSAIESAIGDAASGLKDVAYVVGLSDPLDNITPLPGAPEVTLWQQLHGLANLPGPTCWRLGVTACFRLTGAGFASKTVIAAPGLVFAGANLPPGNPPEIKPAGPAAAVYHWAYNGNAYAQVFAAAPGAHSTALISDMWVEAQGSRDEDWQSKLPARFAATLDLPRLLLDAARASLSVGTVTADWGATPAASLLGTGLRALRLAAGTGIVAGIDGMPPARAWMRAAGFGSETVLACLAADGLKSDALGKTPLTPVAPLPQPPFASATADTAWLDILQTIRPLPALPPIGNTPSDFDTVLTWLDAISAALSDRAAFAGLVRGLWRNASNASHAASLPVPIWMSLSDSGQPGGVAARGLLDLTRYTGDLVLEVSQLTAPVGPLTISICDGETPWPFAATALARMISVTLTLDPHLNQWHITTASPGWTIANPPVFPAPLTAPAPAPRNSLRLSVSGGAIVFGDPTLSTSPKLAWASTTLPPRKLGSLQTGLLVSGQANIRILSAAIAAPDSVTVPLAPPPSDDSFQPRDRLLEVACAPVFPTLMNNLPSTVDQVAHQVTLNAGDAITQLITLRQFGELPPAGVIAAIKKLVMRRANGFLVPPLAVPVVARPTILPLHKAQPVVVPFHVTGPTADEFWNHYCGIGAITQRLDGAGSGTGWYSLNAANVIMAGVPKMLLDPVPLVVGTSNGVAKTELVFDNHPLIAPVAFTEFQDDAKDAPLYRFEHSGQQTPSLVFGGTQQFALYAIGPGGVLPVELRGSHPAMLTASLRAVTPPATAILNTPYLRRVPLGPPVVDIRDKADPFPAPPSTVQPLARELPAPPDAFYIRVESRRVMYLTEQGGGIDAAAGGTLRVDLLELDFGAGSVAAANLTMTLHAPYTLATDTGPQLWTFTFTPDAGDTPIANVTGVGTDEIKIAVTVPPADELTMALSSALKTAKGISSWKRNNLRLVIDPRAGTVTVSTLPAAHAFAEGTPLPWEQAPPAKTSTAAAMPVPNRAAWLEFSSPGSDPNSIVSVVVPDAVVGGQSVTDPDRGGSGRQIALIANGTTQSFRIRPPAMEFQAWLRWIRQAVPASVNGRISAAVDAGALAAAASQATSGQEAARLDDPAVVGIAVRWRDVVPARNAAQMTTRFVAFSPGSGPSRSALQPDQKSGIAIRLTAAASGQTTVAMSDTTVDVSIPYDRVIDLDIHAAIYDTESSRFDNGMGGGLWRGPVSSTSGVAAAMVLGPPLRLRLEVAADFGVTNFDAGSCLKIANPKTGQGTEPEIPLAESSAVIALTPPTADDAGFTRYWLTRRAGTVRVLSRTWIWDGRPLPTQDIDATLFRNYAPSNINPFDTAFLGASQALGWPASGTLPGGGTPSALLRKDLDWGGGVPVWQFHARLISRYAAMTNVKWPDQVALIWDAQPTAHVDARPVVYVMDQGGPALPMPRVALVLPLTQALSETALDRPLPPVMVLLEEPWHGNGDVSERLHCAIETVRFGVEPTAPPAHAQHLFQQAGPDPILTGRGSAEAARTGGRSVAVPLIVHGAAGMTPVPGAGFPDFTATSFLIEMQPPATDGDEWMRWPFLRLRFRRVREPGWLDHDATIDLAGTKIQAVCHDIAVPAAWAGDVAISTDAGVLTITVSRSPSTVLSWNTSVRATPAAALDWGPDWPIDARFQQPSGAFTLRLMVSPHGQKGGGWDVATAVGTRGSAGWSGTAQPLLFGPVATVLGSTSPTVTMTVAGPTLSSRGVRASDWTSPLWCQFSPDASRFTVQFPDRTSHVLNFDSDSFRIVPAPASGLQIEACHPTNRRWQVPNGLAPMGGPDTVTSHAVVLLAAVITQDSNDVFGSIVEDLRRSTASNPLHFVSETGVIAAPAEALTGKGRLRLLTMVQRVSRVGGPTQTPVLLTDLIPSGDATTVTTRIVGISRPLDIPWSA